MKTLELVLGDTLYLTPYRDINVVKSHPEVEFYLEANFLRVTFVIGTQVSRKYVPLRDIKAASYTPTESKFAVLSYEEGKLMVSYDLDCFSAKFHTYFHGA
jgi:hypothetical protein